MGISQGINALHVVFDKCYEQILVLTLFSILCCSP